MLSQIRYTWILVNILFVYHFITPSEGVTVTVEQGELEGLPSYSRNGTYYIAYLSIPYAKPPVEKLRFEPPQEPDSWEGIRKATEQPPECTQFSKKKKGVIGSEDCLYLNVQTPYESVLGNTSLLPVMVYIHGGAMVTGSLAEYNPIYFMDHKIIMVGMQFRLNAMGFLSTGDDIIPGNFGVKDQVAALKWIRKNIASFGGDPNRVTIFGNSSGGVNVNLHMYSPLSRDLFQQAISQSGSALANWAVHTAEDAREIAREYAKKCKCPFTPRTAFLKCLRDLSPDQLVIQHENIKVPFASKKPFPVVIENVKVKNAFLTKNPWTQSIISAVPWLTGLTSGEGAYKSLWLLKMPNVIQEYEDNYKDYFPQIFNFERMNKNMAVETSIRLRKYYFKDNPLGQDPQKLVDIYTDGYYAAETIEAVMRYFGLKYFYIYDHQNTHPVIELYGHHDSLNKTVCHGEELSSLFLTPFTPMITEGVDLMVSEKLVVYWVNFATSGDPNGEEKIWQPIQSDELQYLYISSKKDVMRKDVWDGRYEFWKSLEIFKYRSEQ